MAIKIFNKNELKALEIPNKIVGQTLDLVRSHIKAGVSLNELDSLADDFIRSKGARASFYKLYGFPKHICISVNEVIIHGIPNDYKLKNGDIVGVDIGVEYNGWYGDGAFTCGVGEIDSFDKSLIDCAKDSLYEAINFVKPGLRFKELSAILESAINKRGFVPLRDFCGHGIGRTPHAEPQIPNYLESPNPKQGDKIKEGMAFCLEPMVCQRSGVPKILNDEWAVTSEDGLNGSHYEHTIAVIGGKAKILTEV